MTVQVELPTQSEASSNISNTQQSPAFLRQEAALWFPPEDVPLWLGSHYLFPLRFGS